jgi:tetratricopeptide (TPR) repeat protein
VDEGALPESRVDEYAPAGKVFQPVPLPASGATGLEAALFYDPNIAQFFRWIVLRDLPAPRPDDPDELVRTRSVFHDYFREDWEVAARFDPGLSRGPGITVIRRPEGFEEVDRARLVPLVGVLDGPVLEETRQESRRFQEWIRSAGIAFRQVNDLVPALRFLDQAVHRDPQDVEARYQRALVLLQAERPDLAKSDLLEALAHDPYRGGIHYNLGTILEQEGDLTGAFTEYEAAIRYLDDPAPAHARLGALLVRLGREAEAREHLETLRRIAPGSASEELLRSVLGSP